MKHYYNYYFPRFAKKADRIATVSEFSKQDIAKSYAISNDLIDVVYNGCSDGFVSVSEDKKRAVRKQFTAEAPYFIYVGSIQPRKNLQRLFKAFDQFKKQSGASHKLVIAGQKYFWNKVMKDSLAACEYKNDIIFLGRVQEHELHQLTASAFASVYVPLFEGFGIPLLEAMHCEVPVIASNVSSLPEVAGDAALYCNPTEIAEIAGAMLKLYNDKKLCIDLIAKGNKRKQKFSWDHTADLLWKSCETTLKMKS